MKPSPNVRSRGSAASLELVAEPVVRAALLEDVGRGGDLTTDAIVDARRQATARIVARQTGVVAGMPAVALIAFRLLDRRAWRPRIETRTARASKRAGVVAEISGSARAILTGERTALNLLCRASPASRRRRARSSTAVAGTHAQVSPTRARRRPGCARSSATRWRCGGGCQPPLRPRRRRADQRQPSRPRRLDPCRGRGGARARRAHGQDRNRSRHARTAARGAGASRSTPCSSIT